MTQEWDYGQGRPYYPAEHLRDMLRAAREAEVSAMQRAWIAVEHIAVLEALLEEHGVDVPRRPEEL